MSSSIEDLQSLLPSDLDFIYTSSPSSQVDSKMMTGSPESVLGGYGTWSFSSNGSASGDRLSPPTTPFGTRNDAWDPLARLKISNENNKKSEFEEKGFMGPEVLQNPDCQKSWKLNQLNHQDKCSSIWGKQQQVKGTGWQVQVLQQNNKNQGQIQSRGRRRAVGFDSRQPLGLPLSAWPPLQSNSKNHQQSSGQGGRAISVTGSGGAKREYCAGTGVFLPRRYDNQSSRYDCTSVLFQAKVAADTLNLKLKDMNKQGHDPQSRFNVAFGSDYDVSMVKRNIVLTQHKENLYTDQLNHEIQLPQEWIY